MQKILPVLHAVGATSFGCYQLEPNFEYRTQLNLRPLFTHTIIGKGAENLSINLERSPNNAVNNFKSPECLIL